eukprot:TRINITY_DN56870_c0_g1_i1.p1 TRINITY_DN56870_c0_g1~~TRINITY_DN56870_c0_g1_i1.p1  ORF type:complete len:801 (+),score=202.00 TRINITY_DN56870_c0_g1_i1:80-2482(+)
MATDAGILAAAAAFLTPSPCRLSQSEWTQPGLRKAASAPRVAAASAAAASGTPAASAASSAAPAVSGSSSNRRFPCCSAAAAALCAASTLKLSRRRVGRMLGRRQQQRQARGKAVGRRALPLESANFLSFAQELLQNAGAPAHHGSAEDLANVLQHCVNELSAGLEHVARSVVPPAFAEEAKEAIELDPNTKYLYGADGAVLVDPMNNKPIPDDWWNGFIGFQSDIIKDLDQSLRNAGVKEAFGWTIVAYTVFVKVLFYPLQQGQLRSTSMMQLLSPKVKEIQERYKDDPETQQRLLGQLYGVMDVNPLGGCLPVFLQLPIFWSLYGVWRRLAAEKFPHYTEGWLWVPSLAQPNPDFQFKYDWLFEFKDGQPVMGWSDYLSYLVFPVLLVGFTVISQQQAQAARPKNAAGDDETQALILQVLPLISVYFIGSLALQLPQAVSVYYSVNTVLSVAQTQLVKDGLRKEIPGYEEFEKTGKFPDGAFEDMVKSGQPAPKTIHEAALRGDVGILEDMASADGVDINSWDEKQIAPLGYAVACGHLAAVRFLIKRGADLAIKDGQGNTMLHYAAGYGHLEVLKELLEASKDVWPKDEWKDVANAKGQSVIDAARANRKGSVVDFLSDRLGLEADVVEAEVVQLPKRDDAPPSEPKESSEAADAAKAARAALLAAAGSSSPGSAASEAQPSSSSTAAPAADTAASKSAAAMKAALEQMRSNPQAVEQAKKMLGNIPPSMLSMLSGNKLSAEQAQKAMDAMSQMSTEEILLKADAASQQLASPGSAAAPKETVPLAPSGKAPARSVD